MYREIKYLGGGRREERFKIFLRNLLCPNCKEVILFFTARQNYSNTLSIVGLCVVTERD